MLLAARTGRSLRMGRDLSSRPWRRRLLRRKCCCILAFTRNPFLSVMMLRCYFIKHHRIQKDFEFFQKTSAPTSVGFACSRVSEMQSILLTIASSCRHHELAQRQLDRLARLGAAGDGFGELHVGHAGLE